MGPRCVVVDQKVWQEKCWKQKRRAKCGRQPKRDPNGTKLWPEWPPSRLGRQSTPIVCKVDSQLVLQFGSWQKIQPKSFQRLLKVRARNVSIETKTCRLLQKNNTTKKTKRKIKKRKELNSSRRAVHAICRFPTSLPATRLQLRTGTRKKKWRTWMTTLNSWRPRMLSCNVIKFLSYQLKNSFNLYEIVGQGWVWRGEKCEEKSCLTSERDRL